MGDSSAPPQLLSPGDLVVALPGTGLRDFFNAGDQGTVQSCAVEGQDEETEFAGHLRVHVVWARSGRGWSVVVPDLDWRTALRFVRGQTLAVGDIVRALPGRDLSVGGVDCYRTGDEGCVQNIEPGVGGELGVVRVAWSRTRQITDIPFVTWMTFCTLARKVAQALRPGLAVRINGMTGATHLNGQFAMCEYWNEEKGRWFVTLSSTGEGKLVRPDNLAAADTAVEEVSTPDDCPPSRELEAGDLVRAASGSEVAGFYCAGEEGTVQSVYAKDNGEERINVVWASSGKALSTRKDGWRHSYVLVQRQELQEGDAVQALPGGTFGSGGVEYYRPDDEGVVLGCFSDERGIPHVRVKWSRSDRVSDAPRSNWMVHYRLARKATPAAAAAAAADARLTAAQGSLKPGDRAKIHGIKADPRLNGKEVRLQRFDAARGRWLVAMLTDEAVVQEEEKWLKPLNLEPLK